MPLGSSFSSSFFSSSSLAFSFISSCWETFALQTGLFWAQEKGQSHTDHCRIHANPQTDSTIEICHLYLLTYCELFLLICFPFTLLICGLICCSHYVASLCSKTKSQQNFQKNITDSLNELITAVLSQRLHAGGCCRPKSSRCRGDLLCQTEAGTEPHIFSPVRELLHRTWPRCERIWPGGSWGHWRVSSQPLVNCGDRRKGPEAFLSVIQHDSFRFLFRLQDQIATRFLGNSGFLWRHFQNHFYTWRSQSPLILTWKTKLPDLESNQWLCVFLVFMTQISLPSHHLSICFFTGKFYLSAGEWHLPPCQQ